MPAFWCSEFQKTNVLVNDLDLLQYHIVYFLDNVNEEVMIDRSGAHLPLRVVLH